MKNGDEEKRKLKRLTRKTEIQNGEEEKQQMKNGK